MKIKIDNIYNMDCLKGMDLMIEQGLKVDAIITDPPYGIMDTDGGRKLGINNWDTSINPAVLFEKFEKFVRPNGKVVLFSKEPYTSKLITSTIPSIQFCYRAIWEKDNFANALGTKKNMVSFSEDVLILSKIHNKHDFEGHHPLRKYFESVMDFIGLSLGDINKALRHRKAEHSFYINSTQFSLCTEEIYNELIIVFGICYLDGFKEFEELKCINTKYRDKLILEMNIKYPSVFNLWEGNLYKSDILKYKKDYEGLHPTQKPVALIEDLIKTYTNENDLVLDFTIGSGTTAIACMNTNRRFIGFELDKGYYDIATERINNHGN